ncbi:uncharacterized protein [Temnothorax nylanderi]|uniref:uncharacterized protein n=1 Tax=Temnothorax nylanderi TaxID=102681 RepID=UPI003A88DE95
MRPPLSSASSATSTSEVLSDTEEKVPLGDGIFCSKAAYNKLVNVEESHADWAYALLKGVFGRKAHLMRVRINKKHTENEKFPSNFLMVAKSLHRDWLIKQKIQDESGQLHSKYSATEVEKYVNTLPGYLADRTYDMLGPRGARKRGGDLNAPECRRSGSTKPKRKYTRRGQPLVEIQQLQQQVSHIVQQRISQQLLPPHQQPLPATTATATITTSRTAIPATTITAVITGTSFRLFCRFHSAINIRSSSISDASFRLSCRFHSAINTGAVASVTPVSDYPADFIQPSTSGAVAVTPVTFENLRNTATFTTL